MVEINGEFSDVKHVIAGVPLESVLSPTLYAYYADDTTLYSATKKTNKPIKNVQKAMETIDEFLIKWKIKINAAKAQFIIFPFNRARRRTLTPPIHVFKTTQ